MMWSGLLIERITVLGWTLPWLGRVARDGDVAGRRHECVQPARRRDAGRRHHGAGGRACGAILVVRGHGPEAMILPRSLAPRSDSGLQLQAGIVFLGDSGACLSDSACRAISGWQKGRRRWRRVPLISSLYRPEARWP
jgi:hypothetical protein